MREKQSLERLELLCRVTRFFNSSLHLDEVLNNVMDEVIQLMQAERGFVVLHDGMGHMEFRAARGLDRKEVESPEFEVSRGIIEKVINSRKPLLSIDVKSEAEWDTHDSVQKIGLRSLLCVPLQVRDATLGVIYVDSRMARGAFSPEDMEFLTAIASSAAIAIDNAHYYEQSLVRARLEREAQVARETQTSFIPQNMPQLPGWDFGAMWYPAREVSGDYYDFIWLDNNQLGVIIADVAGKGLPAALFMVLTRSIIRTSILASCSPLGCITQANRTICQDASDGTFVSLFSLLLNESGNTLYVNAGHNAPLLYRAIDGGIGELNRTGMVLGIFDDNAYEQREAALESGDVLMLYTDGVTEAINDANEEYGLDRLRELILTHHEASAREIVEVMKQSIAGFTGQVPQVDDITAVVIKKM